MTIVVQNNESGAFGDFLERAIWKNKRAARSRQRQGAALASGELHRSPWRNGVFWGRFLPEPTLTAADECGKVKEEG